MPLLKSDKHRARGCYSLLRFCCRCSVTDERNCII